MSGKKENYITVQTQLWKKLDLANKLNISSNIKERGRVNGFISSLRQDKKITTKTSAVEQLKDVQKYIENNFDEFKKHLSTYVPKPKKNKK